MYHDFNNMEHLKDMREECDGLEEQENHLLADALEIHVESAKRDAEKHDFVENIFSKKDCLTEETKGLDQCLVQSLPEAYEPMTEEELQDNYEIFSQNFHDQYKP